MAGGWPGERFGGSIRFVTGVSDRHTYDISEAARKLGLSTDWLRQAKRRGSPPPGSPGSPRPGSTRRRSSSACANAGSGARMGEPIVRYAPLPALPRRPKRTPWRTSSRSSSSEPKIARPPSTRAAAKKEKVITTACREPPRVGRGVRPGPWPNRLPTMVKRSERKK